MRRAIESESIDIDKQRGGLIITSQRRVELTNAKDIKTIKTKLRRELMEIVRNVKALKKRAEEIKEMLAKLEAGPSDPAPTEPPAQK